MNQTVTPSNNSQLLKQAIVSLSDTCIRASRSGSVAYSEPGIALLMPGAEPVLGNPAQSALRQQPTRINSRYWSDLNTDALQINNVSVRHNADLAWHQLSQIKSKLDADPAPLSICVPSNLNQQQLQLLTGICQSLELQVSSLINLGVAQLIGHQVLDGLEFLNQQEITHIDLQLHQLVLTNYHIVEAQLELKDQEIIQDISFLRFIDHLLHLLQDKFIQSSRFDPLHSGDTEQQLFDQLIQMISTSEHKAFQVDTDQKQHKIELSSQELHSLANSFKSELVKRLPSSSGKFAYTPVFAQLPGFQFADSEINLTNANTEEGANLLTSQHLNEQESTNSIVYIRSASMEPTAASPQTQAADELVPANAVLFAHQVYQKNTLEALINAGVPEGLITFTETGLLTSSGQNLSVGERITTSADKELVAVRIADQKT